MASTSGTIVAGSGIEYLELLDALVTFLTTGLGGGNNWTVERNTTNSFAEDGDVYLNAPGIANDDSVYVNIQTESDVPNDAYAWVLNGAIGYSDGLVIVDPGQNNISEQPGSIGDDKNLPRILFAEEAIPYWFYANKQRFVVIAHVAGQTVFESCYCGYINSYGTPSDFPVPLFIGGMDTVLENPGVAAGLDRHSWWLHQQENMNATTEPTAYFRMPSGLWMSSDYEDSGLNLFRPLALEKSNKVYIFPYFFLHESNQVTVSEDPDNEHIKTICRVVSTEGAMNNLQKAGQVGELDGIVWTPRVQSIGPLDILQETGPIDYRVFQNGSRTDNRSLFGVLED